MKTIRLSPFLLTCLLILLFLFPAACSTTVTSVYLVRHAEKAAGNDPVLLPSGTARAHELKRVLEHVPVIAVYSTDTNRTRQTAQPLADEKSLTTQIYGDTSVAAGILSDHESEVVLMVGHSNTIPQLIAAFGGPTGISIEEDEYDNLFLLLINRLKRSGSTIRSRTKVLHMKYGAVSP